jgi:hypothetical protein
MQYLRGGGPTYPGIDGDLLGFSYETALGSGLFQTLSATLQADTAYTLTVAEGRRNGTLAAPTLGSKIILFAGTTAIASSTDDTGPAAGTFQDQVAFLANSNTFSSLVGQTLSIAIETSVPYTVTNQATDWDNVRLDASAAAPEPSTWASLLCGTFALVAARRRLGRSR